MRRSLLLLLLTLTACEPNKPADTPQQPAPVPPAPSAEQGGAKAPEPPAPAPPAIPDAEVEALVKAWLDAQNQGDLDAYTALYAARFTGVKKVGPRSSTFDRDGWLKDRGRMFRKVMRVEASDIKISASAQSAVVTFEQSWQSDGYRDVGPKQLIIVREGDGLKIAREELLSSHVEGARELVASLNESQFGHVLSDEGAMVFVITPKVNPEQREHEAPVSVRRGYAAWAKLKGQEKAVELELFGPAGKVCDVKAQEYGLFAHVVPHFGQVQSWDGQLDEALPKLDDAQVAAEVFELAGEAGVHYGVRVDASVCEGAVWGRIKQAVPAAVFLAVDTEPLEVRAQAEVQKLAAWKAIQKDFEADEATRQLGGRWDDHDATKTFGAWQAPDGKTVYVAYSVRAGSGCGQFEGELWAVWRVLGGDGWTLVSDPKAPGALVAPTCAADLDGDGLPELIAPDALIRPAGTIWRTTRDISPPYFDCPC